MQELDEDGLVYAGRDRRLLRQSSPSSTKAQSEEGLRNMGSQQRLESLDAFEFLYILAAIARASRVVSIGIVSSRRIAG
jgi:hypothetical protein